ncbi:hypothetical protein L6164_037342 [Bauhinia variegata]|uniref:Uncharacterized protein n=1 Tax=Bauhinia variegata TaxID=167791 RepID=A0ACB9KJX2_BAUVA|nr:hypothetical protein L6164_037342 [Bauhinia variegata]
MKPYRYAQAQKDIIEKMVQETLQAGIIQPSSSPYASPVVLVKKKDRSWQFCIDFRRLNNITIKNKFLTSLIEEVMDELEGATTFSKLDLRAGYHQICVYPPDIPKTAFKTHSGFYECGCWEDHLQLLKTILQ